VMSASGTNVERLAPVKEVRSIGDTADSDILSLVPDKSARARQARAWDAERAIEVLAVASPSRITSTAVMRSEANEDVRRCMIERIGNECSSPW